MNNRQRRGARHGVNVQKHLRNMLLRARVLAVLHDLVREEVEDGVAVRRYIEDLAVLRLAECSFFDSGEFPLLSGCGGRRHRGRRRR